MPKIDSTKFGEIVIAGKKYGQVLIIGDKIVERDYDKLKKLFGTAHKIADWEIEQLLSNNPEAIVIGTGQDGLLEVDEEFKRQMAGRGIELIVGKTFEALEVYNEKIKAGQRANALMHTTC
ncbi:MAG: hypothetical protein COY09_01725 [Candidatus Portnoybacteria bacterium CG_4_10_14_0_2_um_filter_39_11]|uniref:Uncharacterized protein n=1 Tax=Candidatus Portnoybacteria bacterium CG_4_10_14_0_2_um_filter_39_11 TaxID=1974797 RepID=A0A2M7UID4_9BACT|nr:MAG: hypothetical protein AUJ33_01575 [Parcubacteria group bacterium CG1_02_40_25]PIZ70970.1 MAG: hypothetical protein COY09_01725 [Candidatus Portnoybacteria bacterium CG_4_10_14_0_2_um_filter_39_11]